jgi:hypothetical protein
VDFLSFNLAKIKATDVVETALMARFQNHLEAALANIPRLLAQTEAVQPTPH